jgi:hypothetical protein
MRQTSFSYLQTKVLNTKKLNEMKTLFEKLRALLKALPQFQVKYLMLKCPDFIVKAFLGKTEIAPEEEETFWHKAPAVTSRPCAIDSFQYQPEYQ